MFDFYYRIEPIPLPQSDESHMGAWGPMIVLDIKYARLFYNIKRTPTYTERLEEIIKNDVIRILGDYPLFMYGQSYLSFIEDTTLIHGISIPGDRAGIYQEHSSSMTNDWPIKFLPHNVDCKEQTLAIIQSFLLWTRYTEILLPDKD